MADMKELVDRFLRWPLPESVCSDACVVQRGYPHRIGTNLLTADEARQMLEYVLADRPAATVPREPTPEMLEAIEGHFRKWQKIIPGISDDDVKADSWNALQAYRAMLSAAPQSRSDAAGDRLEKVVIYAVSLMEVEKNYDKALQYLKAVQDNLPSAPEAKQGG